MKVDYEQNKYILPRIKSVLFDVKSKYFEKSGVKLELLEDDSVSESELEHLEVCDKKVISPSRKFSESKHCTSSSMNSLDLEWEHLPEMNNLFTSSIDELKSATSAEAWSRISSADSLEWDVAEVQMKDELDTETEQLLQEIELLSSKTLLETQEWAS